jgi:hypothetical protein
MRVFYTDDYEKRTFYVKIDNIMINKEDNGYKAIMAETGYELLDEVIKVYGFNEGKKENIQIWSHQLSNINAVRLDTMNKIPSEYEFVYVRGILNRSTY